jgi:hypothetical protein
MACLVYCANLKETHLFFVETARDVLSLDPSDEKLLTWGRGIRFGYGFYLSICQRRHFLKGSTQNRGFNSNLQAVGTKTVVPHPSLAILPSGLT